MNDAPDDAVGERAPDQDEGPIAGEGEATSEADGRASDAAGDPAGGEGVEDAEDIEALREQVEEKYDFENFGPAEMQEMGPEEWDAAFDPESWITGEELLDRVEADLKTQVLNRDVFARVERFDDLLVAYSDSGYAAVYPDGSVEGRGTVLRDVKPTVALCSMDSYDVPEMPEGDLLPDPQEIPDTSSSALGNTVLQVVGAIHVLAGLALLGAWVLFLTGLLSRPGTNTQGLNLVLLVVAGLGFLIVGVFLFVVVANARLSDKFRAEEFRGRLRAIGLEDGERPAFLEEIEGLPEELPAGSDATPDERSGTQTAAGGASDSPQGADGDR